MKKQIFITTTLLFLSSISLKAQNCKNVKQKTDPFTNKTEKFAEIFIGNLSSKWSVDFQQIEGITTMKWGLYLEGEFNQQFDKGTKLLFKLEDGSIVTILTSESASPVSQLVGVAGSHRLSTTYKINFIIPKETLTSLSKSVIVSYKIDAQTDLQYPKLKENQAEKIKEISGCLIND